MARSEARRRMSLLIEAYGTNGVLVVRKTAPCAPLAWPPCECGRPVCPDYRGPDDEPSPPAPSTGPDTAPGTAPDARYQP